MASDTIRYSFDHMFAAMCIWEEMCSPTMQDAGEPWSDLRNQIGTCALRELVITHLAEACDKAWARAYALWEEAFREWDAKRRNYEHHSGKRYEVASPAEPGPFDYEFVPFWIRAAVDWSDHLNGPRVIGNAS